MSRKISTSGRPGAKATAPPDTKRAPTLTDLRGEIDRLDKELVSVLNQRAEVALKIGQVKQKQGIEVWSPAREDEVIARALATSRGPLPEETLRLIFRELMSGSRALQRALRVAYLGPKYSYSHLASISQFGEAVEHVPVGSIAAVFEEINRRHVHFGLVPLENSTDGRVADTLDMFARLPGLKIRAEVRLKVHHCLLGRCEWGQVQRVYSKAQALSQCRNWISKNLPQARVIDVVSTAAAAEHASREEFAAAVASRAAGGAYHLNVLASNIEDQTHNVTRFAVIGERSEVRTGRDKTTLMLRIANEAGSLSKVIAPFEKGGVNMTWIESFPAPEGPGDRNPTYLFFIDVEGHLDDEPVKRSLDAVRKKCQHVEILGSYPRGACVET
ncbi:MAG: prephenate dehydratase [Isosphaeraceae bacterium]